MSVTKRSVPPVEWPTVLLCVIIYGGWAALTWFWHELPSAVIVILGSWQLAWFMSLQHELLHGHPTRHQWLNDALGFAPLALWLPYARYKDNHLEHHRDEQLTDPGLDPESAYVGAADWAAMGPVGRWLHLATVTFVGRLIVAPWRFAIELWKSDGAQILAGNQRLARIWLLHFAGVAAVISWLTLCGISPLTYALLVVWPATGLVFLRSLAEQVRRLQQKVEREQIVLAALPELSLQIVEFAREHGRVTIGDAIKLTGVSRNTLKQHFRNLVAHGHLDQQGGGRGAWYGLK